MYPMFARFSESVRNASALPDKGTITARNTLNTLVAFFSRFFLRLNIEAMIIAIRKRAITTSSIRYCILIEPPGIEL